jgi:hypothetical protein
MSFRATFSLSCAHVSRSSVEELARTMEARNGSKKMKETLPEKKFVQGTSTRKPEVPKPAQRTLPTKPSTPKPDQRISTRKSQVPKPLPEDYYEHERSVPRKPANSKKPRTLTSSTYLNPTVSTLAKQVGRVSLPSFSSPEKTAPPVSKGRRERASSLPPRASPSREATNHQEQPRSSRISSPIARERYSGPFVKAPLTSPERTGEIFRGRGRTSDRTSLSREIGSHTTKPVMTKDRLPSSRLVRTNSDSALSGNLAWDKLKESPKSRPFLLSGSLTPSFSVFSGPYVPLDPTGEYFRVQRKIIKPTSKPPSPSVANNERERDRSGRSAGEKRRTETSTAHIKPVISKPTNKPTRTARRDHSSSSNGERRRSSDKLENHSHFPNNFFENDDDDMDDNDEDDVFWKPPPPPPGNIQESDYI